MIVLDDFIDSTSIPFFVISILDFVEEDILRLYNTQ